MTLSRELCDIAQKWADHLAAEKAFEHSKTDDRKCGKGATGENLYYSGSTGELEINGSAAVDSWYNEIKDYDFEKPGFAMNTGKTTHCDVCMFSVVIITKMFALKFRTCSVLLL